MLTVFTVKYIFNNRTQRRTRKDIFSDAQETAIIDMVVVRNEIKQREIKDSAG